MAFENPNQGRRLLPGMALACAYPLLRLALWILPRPRPPADARVVLFQSYQVGDFFMALPAIRRLHGSLPVTVLCRPDCAFALARLGIPAVPGGFPFQSRPGLRTFLASLAEAYRLRSRLGPEALDFHADPRTAFFLKLAGVRAVSTFRRPWGFFFDREFPLSPGARHQGEKDMDLAERFLASGSAGVPAAPSASAIPAAQAVPPASSIRIREGAGASVDPSPRTGGIVLSCWTRRPEKNWPLARWDLLLERLLATGREPKVLVPPDGDAEYAAFRRRWEGRAEFVEADLERIHDLVRGAAAAVATDNFLGHLAAGLGKPVFWINGSSDPSHVRPLGPGVEVVQVEPMPCRPCGHRCRNPVRLQCLAELHPGAVLPRLEAWLALNGL